MFSSLVVFGYVAVLTVRGQGCPSKEYKARDGECCPMCNAGTFVQRDCTPQSGTRCSPCQKGTYMNQPNGLSACFLCKSCDQGHGIFAKQECTATSDTVCDALSGYFCKSLADDTGCSLAEKHTRCAAGQRIKDPGTSRTDTVCELCQPGYFSQDGTNCSAWTICSESHIKVKEGSLSSDVVCGSASRQHYFYISVLLSLLTIVGLVISGEFCFVFLI